MRHDRHGYWLEEAGPVSPAAPAAGDVRADVVVIGGGYAGMWTAWHLLERAPDARVVLLEADICGHGPSGRNGGFCETLWTALPSLRERFGDERALAACEASTESVRAIGAWCEAEGVDAWFRRAGYIMASTTPSEDATLDRILAAATAAPPRSSPAAATSSSPAATTPSPAATDLSPAATDLSPAATDLSPAATGSSPAATGSSSRHSAPVVPLDQAAVRARCDSPLFRRGILVADDATVQPARLALGLRRRLLERGAAVHEHSRVRALRVVGPHEVVAETASARVRAGAAILAVNAATRGVRPLRARLAVTSSHIVLTEPVPDVLEAIGWTGGEAITDGRTFVHYLRTTPDARIAFGWGAGRPAFGARLGRRIEVDPSVVAAARRQLVELLPALAGRRITHAWGGPIDVSPSHLPQIGTLSDGPVHYAFGFTGNGVGPSHLAGRALAGLALGADDADTRLALVDPTPAIVPPEPLAWAGGNLVRRAFLRAERLEAAGRRPDALTRAVCAAPRALGLHVSR